MARRSLSVCSKPGCPELTQGAWCPDHQPKRLDHGHAVRSTRAWQHQRAAVLNDWRAMHGDWCPGYQRPPHPSADLTVDHVTALANGGTGDHLAVLCRSCNSRKGSR